MENNFNIVGGLGLYFQHDNMEGFNSFRFFYKFQIAVRKRSTYIYPTLFSDVQIIEPDSKPNTGCFLISRFIYCVIASVLLYRHDH